MMPEDRAKITSNEYMDLLIQYNGNMEIIAQYQDLSVQIMNPSFAVVYLPVWEIPNRLYSEFGYASLPLCYALMQDLSLEASGITKLRGISALNLRGKGVLIGMVDTGIDYTNPVFQNEDGTTRIVSIWDQSIESEDGYPDMDYPAYFGTEYTREQINEAIKSPNPLEVVPSMDTNGHGTKLAGIAAGSEDRENDFTGIATDSELIVVKLKQAKQNIMDYFSIPTGVPCYQENDMIWGIQYLVEVARKLQRPLAICIGVGTSQGAHDDSGFLNTEVSLVADFPGVALSVAGGNEGNARRHFYSALDPDTSVSVELNVGENESGFTMELWGDPPMLYTLDILSPNGEYIPAITERLEESRRIRFVFEQTIITIRYIMIEQITGKQVILLNFQSPTAGTWKFQVYGRGDLRGAFHIWLPAGDFITRDTYFTEANSYTTLTSPANSIVPISMVAYNSNSGTLYSDSGKGFSTSNIINPDLAAPGVNLMCPGFNHEFTTMTGTSAASAHMVGITAMVLEWGVVNNNYPNIDTLGIKKMLIRGAQRNRLLQYPNRAWGYGIVDIYNAYNIFRTDT